MVQVHADGGPSTGRGFHIIAPALLPGLHRRHLRRRPACSPRRWSPAWSRRPAAPTYLSSTIQVRKDTGAINMSDVPTITVETLNMRNASDARAPSSTTGRQRSPRASTPGSCATSSAEPPARRGRIGRRVARPGRAPVGCEHRRVTSMLERPARDPRAPAPEAVASAPGSRYAAASGATSSAPAPSRRSPRRCGPPRSGWSSIGALVALGWAVTGRGDDGIGTPLAAAGVVWLVAHHAPVVTESGATSRCCRSLLLALPLLAAAPRRPLGGAHHRDHRRAATPRCSWSPATATYAALAFRVAQVAPSPARGVPASRALGWAALVAVVGLGWGVARGAGSAGPAAARGCPTRCAARLSSPACRVPRSWSRPAPSSVVAVVARWSTVTGLERQVAPGRRRRRRAPPGLARLPAQPAGVDAVLRRGPRLRGRRRRHRRPLLGVGGPAARRPAARRDPDRRARGRAAAAPAARGGRRAAARWSLRRRGALPLADEVGAVLLGALRRRRAGDGRPSALAGGALGSARLAQLGPHALLTGLAVAGLVAAGGAAGLPGRADLATTGSPADHLGARRGRLTRRRVGSVDAGRQGSPRARRPPPRLRLVVLVSGSGTNLQALLDACADPAYPAEVVAVGADRAGILALERAERAGHPDLRRCASRDFADRERLGRRVHRGDRGASSPTSSCRPAS